MGNCTTHCEDNERSADRIDAPVPMYSVPFEVSDDASLSEGSSSGAEIMERFRSAQIQSIKQAVKRQLKQQNRPSDFIGIDAKRSNASHIRANCVITMGNISWLIKSPMALNSHAWKAKSLDGAERAVVVACRKHSHSVREPQTAFDNIVRVPHHTNVAKTFGYTTVGEMHCCAVEYFRFGNLHSYLSEMKSLYELEVSIITRDVLQGLRHLHASGVFQVDLRPSQIFISDFGHCTLSCHGRILLQGSAPDQIAYYSPEEVRGTFGAPSNVWAVGTLVAKLSLGSAAHACNAMKVLNGTLPADVLYGGVQSEVCRDFLSKCLKDNPMDRSPVEELLQHPFVNPNIPAATINSVRKQMLKVMKSVYLKNGGYSLKQPPTFG